MQIGNLIIEPWNKHNAIWRIVALLLVALWAVWGAVIYYESAQLTAKVRAEKEAQQREEERLERAASYRRAALQRQAQLSGVQNAVDAFKR